MSEQAEFDWNHRTIQHAFEEFHKAHPEIYEYLVRLALEAYRKGFRHYGIGALWERMRWHFQVERDMEEDFKLNNNYRSRYARKIIDNHPELAEFFELRALRTE